MYIVKRIFVCASIVAFTLFFVGCKSSDNNLVLSSDAASSNASPKPNAYQELIDIGGDRYRGLEVVTPISSRPVLGSDVVVHSFPTEPGTRYPSSMTGEPYRVQTRDGSSNNLLIYFQGGGICVAESCMAFNFGSLIANRLPDAFDILGGILSRDSSNPLAEYNLVHANYSDGSLMLGDLDNQPRMNAQGETIYVNHRGLMNLTATFEVAKKEYPSPDRIVVAGSSAGSIASIVAVIFARTYYPDTPIHAILDSGTGVINDLDPDFLVRGAKSIGVWELMEKLKSCPDCFGNGHGTNFIRWVLDKDNEDDDKKIKFALLSTTRDHVISTFAMNPADESDYWKEATERELTSLASEYPDTIRVFMIPGRTHVFLIGDFFLSQLVANSFLGLLFPEGYEGTEESDQFYKTVLSPFIVGDRSADIFASEHFKFGNYSQTGINTNNQRVTVKEFIRDFLNDTDSSLNVINPE